MLAANSALIQAEDPELGKEKRLPSSARTRYTVLDLGHMKTCQLFIFLVQRQHDEMLMSQKLWNNRSGQMFLQLYEDFEPLLGIFVGILKKEYEPALL